MNQAYLFPGQGSQKVGMGKDLYNEFSLAKKRFNEANELLNRDVKAIIFNGPENELRATQNTQPALFVVESILFELLSEVRESLQPTVCLGHSLGEYSALFAAGVISFSDGLQLVAKRGELMAEAGKHAKGTMAAIIGLSYEEIINITSSITHGVVIPANINSPEQIVISGDVEAIDESCEKLKSAGAKFVKKLPVSGAFHSPLMQPVAEEFKEYLSRFTFHDAHCPIICNVTATAEKEGSVLKNLLVKQLISPVRWVESINWLINNAICHCIEVGPGSVLRGLARKCSMELSVISCNSVNSIYSFKNE